MSLGVNIEAPASTIALTALAEGLTALNFAMMSTLGKLRAHLGAERFPSFPPLYGSGIVYRRERPGRERWQTAMELLASRSGDCEDLSAYRAAELRCEGEPAVVEVVRTPRGTFHAVVRRADGRYEDPSKILLGLERQLR